MEAGRVVGVPPGYTYGMVRLRGFGACWVFVQNAPAPGSCCCYVRPVTFVFLSVWLLNLVHVVVFSSIRWCCFACYGCDSLSLSLPDILGFTILLV